MSIIQGHAKSSGVTAGFYPTTINQSLRFEDGDSSYLTFDPAADGDRQNWSLSFWFKRANLGLQQLLFGQGTSGSNNLAWVYIDAADELTVADYGGSYTFRYVTTQKFRDPSAWYHLAISYQASDATASDRLRIWLNGERITAFNIATDPALNANTAHFNTGSPQYISRFIDQANSYLDGYMAEVHFTDGTAYTADAFGELKSGIWVPKTPSVTYGTNGFYLDFADGAAIGDDESGNGNDWTVNNLVASDVVPDSPTNNFATFNPEQISINTPTFSEGNLKHSCGAAFTSAYSSISPTSGKWYAEVYKSTSTVNCYLGIQLGVDGIDWDSSSESRTGTILYYADGRKRIDGTMTAYGASYTTGDVIGIAVDFDSEEITFYKNGSSQGALAFSASSGDASAATFISFIYNQNVIANFGQDSTFAGNKTAGGNSDANGIGDFAYAPPTGFLALCTSNLPDPVIDPAQDATPEDYINVVLYTGDGTEDRAITGVGFQPDFLWIKARGSASHQLVDVVRGANNQLLSDSSIPEFTGAHVDSFDSDGFTISYNGSVATNGNLAPYVAWNWKAGGTGVSNTDGSITSTVSANTDAGFSIVTYNGNFTAGATVGHGLTQAPEMIIVKDRDNTYNWQVYHKDLTTDHSLLLNTTAASADYNAWNNSSHSATTFTLGAALGVNTNAADLLAYCFHSVDGFSKVGSYIGNGSTDGPFVYTGFRPAFVMVKRTSATENWVIYDNEREGVNPHNDRLYPNLSNAEFGFQDVDLCSNGFKARNVSNINNGSGHTYIYLAFAEQPAKYSNAR